MKSGGKPKSQPKFWGPYPP